MANLKVLFIVPYPTGESPSQRFRFEQYFDLLSNNGFQCEVNSFLSRESWRLFYGPGKLLEKVAAIWLGFLRRFILLFKIHQFDFIFIHREAAPIGPPILEWLISHLFRKKIIYDFDDAIWLTDSIGESTFVRLLRWRKKVSAICRWSYKVSCGNDYLASFARTHNVSVIVNPTTIDTTALHNLILYKITPTTGKRVSIGWTGSHSTLKYLNLRVDVLKQIELKYPNVEFIVIADRQPDLDLKNLKFLPWNPETEITDLLKIDIGIMPLPDDEWAKGKCGFKALQYMALGIPAVISPVGVNRQIVDNGENGFLCSTVAEWLSALTKLIEDPGLREQMGRRGRSKIMEHYSVESNSRLFFTLFE